MLAGRLTWVLISTLYFSLHASAQTNTFKNLRVKDGLPSTEVYDVLQDSKGFMWFATDNGVVRFDGYDMTVLRTADGLEDPVVFQMCEDSRGRIWFRTFSNRYFYFEKGKVKRYRFNDLVLGLMDLGNVTSFVVDSLDRVWLAGKGIYHIDTTGKVTEHSPSLSWRGGIRMDAVYQFNGRICTIQSDSRANGNSYTIFSLYIDGRPFPVEASVSKAFIRSVSWHDRLYISIGREIFEYDGTSVKKALVMPWEIISLRADGNKLWIGYFGHGVEPIRLPDLIRLSKPELASDKTVTQIYSDQEQGLWLSTLEAGIFYVPDVTVNFQATTERSKVKTVAGDSNSVAVARYDQSLTLFDAKTKKIVENRTNLFTILDLFKDSRGNLWVSTTKGLHLLDKDTRKFIAHDPAGRIRGFAEDKNGNIWGIVNLGGSALRKYDPSGKILAVRPYPKLLTRNMLLTESRIYLAKTLGLQVYDTSMTKRSEPLAMASFKISKMLSLNDSVLLVATIGNGLLVVNNRDWSYKKYSATKSLVSDNIYSAEIRHRKLWLGTEKGILVTDVDSLVEGKPCFIQFSSGHGLVEDKVNFLVLMNEEVWAFSDAGMSIVPYTSIYKRPASPKIYFKDLVINSDTVDVTPRFQLRPDQNNIEISFGFLSFHSQEILCRFRLSTDDRWTYTRERVFRFTSLAPGSYKLEVEYSTDNDHWSSVDVPLHFNILPPWWQRWYTQGAAFLLLMVLGFFFVRHRYRSINARQHELMQTEFETLERERSRIAKELHDGVATNLGALKLMVSHRLRKHNDPGAPELDEHFLATLNEIKTIIYGLAPAGLARSGLFKGLQTYIDRIGQTIPFKIELQIKGEDIYTQEIGLLTFRIVQELMANAIKHSGAQHIFIYLESTDDTLNLIFQDDGVGFSFDDTKGHGLANIRSRVNSVQGHMKFESSPRLTSFTISLPRH